MTKKTTQEGTPFKNCTKCRKTKPVSEFSRHKRHRDGLQSHCKACKAVADKAYAESNRKKVSAKKRAWYDSHTELSKKRAKAHYNANKERHAMLSIKWRKDCRSRPAAGRGHLAPEPGKKYTDWALIV